MSPTLRKAKALAALRELSVPIIFNFPRPVEKPHPYNWRRDV